MEGAPPTAKRKILFIKKGFQTSFIMKFCLIVLLSSLILGNILFWTSRKSTTILFQDLRVKTVPTQQFLYPSIKAGTILSLIIASVLTIILSLVASHRIGGPMFRFERVLKQLEEGDLKQKVYLRDYDQCKEIGQSLNETLISLRKKIQNIDEALTDLEEKIDSKDPELKELLEQLKSSIQQFKY